MSSASIQDRPAAAGGAGLFWAGFLLGWALGGFFDGILLHQILQWHHLLSGVDRAALADLRMQVLADGVFHALMYLLALAGLWLLWRRRFEAAAPGAGRRLLGDFLLGFGVWHLVDAVLVHWLLGLHRIRMDAASPLLWDLPFFALGLLLAAGGRLVRRGAGADGDGGAPGRGRAVLPALLAGLVLVAGPVAALPPAEVEAVAVLFRPGTTAERALAAMAAVDGRPIAGEGGLWVVAVPDAAAAGALYRHGALYVGGSFLPLGCLGGPAPPGA